MSNLAIVLCAVLFGSVASRIIWEAPVDSAQRDALKAINATILEFENRFKIIHNEDEEKGKNLLSKATKVNNKIMEELWGVVAEVSLAITKGAENISDAILDDCNTYFEHLLESAKAVYFKTETCIDGKLKIGNDYIANIDKHFTSEIAKLMEIRSQMGDCTDNTSHLKADTEALTCIKLAQDKVDAITTRFDKILTYETVGLDFLLATMDSNLTQCEQISGLDAFRRESLTVVDNTKRCYQEKTGILETRNPSVILYKN